ncbi:DUF5678 domain-containing protein [Chloroflexota bacterium]
MVRRLSKEKVTLEKAFTLLGGRDKFESQYQQYTANVCLIDKIRSKLPKEYKNQWVAVHNSRVVANEGTYHGVVKILKRKNVPIGETAVKHLSSRRAMTLY